MFIPQEGYKAEKYKTVTMEMNGFFDSIAGRCPAKRINSLCKKLAKKCSLKSSQDMYHLRDLAYLLYTFGREDLAMGCIVLTKSVEFRDDRATLWSPIRRMWD